MMNSKSLMPMIKLVHDFLYIYYEHQLNANRLVDIPLLWVDTPLYNPVAMANNTALQAPIIMN